MKVEDSVKSECSRVIVKLKFEKKNFQRFDFKKC